MTEALTQKLKKPKIEGLGESKLVCSFGPVSGFWLTMIDSSIPLTIVERTVPPVFNEGVAAFQMSTKSVDVHRHIQGSSLVLQTAPGICGLAVDSQRVVVWTKHEIQVFNVDDGGVEMMYEFASNRPASVALYQESLFVAQGHDLFVTDLNGIQRLSIRFADEPLFLDVASNFLALATSGGTLQLMDISRKEPTLIHKPGNFVDHASGEMIGPIASIKCNADGSLIAVATEAEVFVYDTKNGQVNKLVLAPPNSVPTFYSWDPVEAQLMVCQFQPRDDSEPAGIAVLFVSERGDVRVHETFTNLDPSTFLLAINTPRLYLAQCEAGEMATIALSSRIMRDFNGMEDDSPSTLSAIVQFSYYLALGEMDKAYIAVVDVEKPTVWESLCRVCVERNRLDLAERCLSNMGNAQGVAAVRLAKESEPEHEVALATLAIQLGLFDDAARLYRECKRHDLLSDLLQAQGRWDEALSVAREHDPLGVRNIHLKHVLHLDSVGCERSAFRQMEQCGVYSKPLLRKLISTKRFRDVENYVSKARDPELMQWLAAHFESSGNFEKAGEWYQRAGDDLSLVRMALHEDDIEAALSIVDESNNAAASYHVGRYLEGTGNIREAVAFYERSGLQSHAIRLSKSHGLCSELMALALKSNTPQVQVIESARYFEQRGDVGNAAQLYAKGGCRSKALDLCFRAGADQANDDLAQLFAALVENFDTSSDDLSDIDVERYANFLIEKGHGEKAVALLCQRNGNLSDIISLCDTHHIIVTDSLARELSPDSKLERAERVIILTKLAALCQKQGNHQLASKLFTKGGDRVSAMKCLLQEGETGPIIAYAKTVKMKETYIMAANFLQATNAWHKNSSLVEAIILFLSKAKRYEGLVRFYASWSQSEIDEHRDYDKALETLAEACKYAEKVRDEKRSVDLCRNLERQIYSINRFLQAKALMERDPSAMQKLCTDLLEKSTNNRHSAVRAEHCVALLCNYYAKMEKFEEAYDAMQSITHPQTHIDMGVIEAVHRANGKDLHFEEVANDDGVVDDELSE